MKAVAVTEQRSLYFLSATAVVRAPIKGKQKTFLFFFSVQHNKSERWQYRQQAVQPRHLLRSAAQLR